MPDFPDRSERDAIWSKPLLLHEYRVRLERNPATYRVVQEVLRNPDREVTNFEVADALGLTVDQVDGYMSDAARIAAIIQGRNDKLGVWPWDCPREGVWMAPKRIADLLLPRT